MQRIIYIYSDEGVSETAPFALKTSFHTLDPTVELVEIKATEVIKGKWHSQALAFIMPGGADLFYCQKLNGIGNQQIRKFVEQGGTYLGFCAGAYYASSYCDFAYTVNPHKHYTIGPRELAFYPGHAIGPYLRPYKVNSESGSCIAEIEWLNSEKHTAYFNGGCYFSRPELHKNITVLARYANKGFEKHAAVIECKVKKGKAILSGMHPEYTAEVLGVLNLDNHLNLKDISSSVLLRNIVDRLK